MTVEQLLARARGTIGLPTRYRLGGGVLDPRAPDPRDEQGGADCSAWACWVLGLRKYQPDFARLVRFNGGWLNTDGIWWDAQEPVGYFERLVHPEIGAIRVYPSRAVSKMPGSRIGHVGIVSDVTPGGRAAKVIHCSSGNWQRRKDAVAETPADVFDVGSALDVWCSTVLRP